MLPFCSVIQFVIVLAGFPLSPPPLKPKQVGDFSKGMAEADHKILSAEVCLSYLLYNFFPIYNMFCRSFLAL